MNLQELADSLFHIKATITELNKEVKDLTEQKTEAERELIDELNKLGLDQIRTDTATYSVKEETVPVAKDWEAIGAWVIKNNAMHLLQRRLSSVSYREFLELGEEIPGTEAFTKSTISTRKK